MEIKGILLDMDGTILDTERLSIESWKYVNEVLGTNVSTEFVLRSMGLPSKEIAEKFNAVYGDQIDYYTARKLRIEHMDNYMKEHGVPLKPGILKLLDTADSLGISCAVATSTSSEKAPPRLIAAGIYTRFKAVICGDMVANGKPEPDIFIAAAEAIGIKPGECVAIEDSRNGIIAAKRSGAFAMLVPDVIKPDKDMLSAADCVLPDLYEAEKYIREKLIAED